jgi:hypothetical protein
MSSTAPPNAKPKNPASEPLDPDVVEKLCKIFSVMSSPNDGDKVVAVNAFNNALERNGVDYHVLVARMKKPWLSDSAKEQFKSQLANARVAGRSETLREVEAKQYGIDDFRNADGSPDWRAIALYVQREKLRLPDRHHEFVDDMAARVPFSRELSPKQLQYLESLFLKLGGKIT